MVVVVEPTRRSLGTAAQIVKLAEDIGLTRIFLVGNRIRNDEDADFLATESMALPVLGHLPDDPGVIEADWGGEPVYAAVPALREAAGRIADALEVASIAAGSQESEARGGDE